MVNGNIEALFKDRKQQEAVFPITKIKAISDNDGVGLDTLLEQMDEQINNKAPAGYGLGEVSPLCLFRHKQHWMLALLVVSIVSTDMRMAVFGTLVLAHLA